MKLLMLLILLVLIFNLVLGYDSHTILAITMTIICSVYYFVNTNYNYFLNVINKIPKIIRILSQPVMTFFSTVMVMFYISYIYVAVIQDFCLKNLGFSVLYSIPVMYMFFSCWNNVIE